MNNLEVCTGLLGTEFTLVRVVAAVVLAVTLPGVGDASAVAASELARLAGHVEAAVFVWNKIGPNKVA